MTWSLLSPAGEVVGRVLPNGTNRRYYHKDLLGTTRAVVTETGALAEAAAYDAWGVKLDGRLVSPETGTREGFTGKQRLGATASGGTLAAFDDFGARTYAPAFGRFVQTDPLADAMPAWSPYAYAFDNPLAFTDPDGRAPEDCCKRLGEIARTANAYAAGVVVAIADNAVPGTNIRESVGSQFGGNAAAFNRGQDLGDAAAIVVGGAEIIGGVTTATGGGALTLTGGGAVVGVPAVGVGGTVAAHGTVMGISGARNLVQQNGRIVESRGSNKLEPDRNASGSHTTWREGPNGQVQRHETWDPNPINPRGFDSRQSTDLVGRAHRNRQTGEPVPTPHTQGRNIPGRVRSAHPNEIPRRRR